MGVATESNDNIIKIDVTKISKHTQNVIAAATLDLINGILVQPGGRESLDNFEKGVR